MTMIGVGPSVASIMQTKKARHFCPNHMAQKGRSQDLNVGGWIPEPVL